MINVLKENRAVFKIFEKALKIGNCSNIIVEVTLK